MTASQMKKLFLSEFDTSDKNATSDNAEKNADETAEKEKKQITMIIQTHGVTYYKIAARHAPLNASRSTTRPSAANSN